MGRFVIVAYRPKPGLAAELKLLIQQHQRLLRQEGLISAREAYCMQAVDGCVLEVFEWRSVEAIDRAHQLPAMQDMWQAFEKVCEFVPLARLPEAQQMFAEFDTIMPEP